MKKTILFGVDAVVAFCVSLINQRSFSPLFILNLCHHKKFVNAFQSETTFSKQSEVMNKTEDVQPSINNEIECGIWLAQSTIKGAGLGMYAGKYFQIDEEILPSGDSVIALLDLEYHRVATGRANQPFLWDDYTWHGKSLNADMEGRYSVHVASPGLGAAANSFLPIYNVHEWYPEKDNVGLHRSRHPSVGSFSPYHNRKSTARMPISSGQELFVSYGEEWFTGRDHLGPIPLDDDFNKAQILINSFISFQQDVGHDVASKAWDAFIRNTTFKESRVFGSFHHNDLDELDILTTKNISITELRQQQASRSLSWLRQYGTCGDHLTARSSTLVPLAGRGAFATRNLPKDVVVAQLPLIHISDRKILDMNNFAVSDDGEKFMPLSNSGRMGIQLLLNYCFGHKQSTLLLCPYGPLTNYVNHNQTLANVKLRWRKQENGNHNPELLNQPISTFSKDGTAKLAMELVATRNINEGEEVFLDYGDEWEMAWQEHVKNWNPVLGAEQYKSAADFNTDRETRLPSVFEQMNQNADRFPPNVELKCDASFEHSYAEEWKDSYVNGTIDHFLEFHSTDYWPCIILRSELIVEDGDYFYTVHIFKTNDDNEEDEDHESEYERNNKLMENEIVENLPRVALRFFDMAYTDDTSLPNAFRHDIRIPDDIFPEKWINLVHN